MRRLRDALDLGDVDRLRFHVQWISFVLLVYGGRLAFALGNSLPTFGCPFTPGRGGTCYLFALQHQLNLGWKDVLGGRGIGLLVGLLTFLAFFAVLSKAWCGFVCPLGTLQDWAMRLRARLGLRPSSYRARTFARLSWVKWGLLAATLLIPLAMANSLLGLPRLSSDWSTAWCQVCPGRTLLSLAGGETGQLAVDFSSVTLLVLTALGMAFTGVVVAASFVKDRFFCLFCPMSALQHAFSRLGLLRLRKRGGGCTRCGDCHRACDMGIASIADDVVNRNMVVDDCMLCLKCVAACPEDGVLEATFAGLPVYRSTQRGFFARAQRKVNREIRSRQG